MSKKKPPTKAELEWMKRVKSLPCSTCGAPPPSIAHHPREGQGMSMRNGHYMTVPHCDDCHVGAFSIHKSRDQFNRVYGSEMSRVNETIGKVFKGRNG